MEAEALWNIIEFILCLTLVIGVFGIIPTCKIFGNAGYSKWWAVLIFIPIINIIALWIFAFADWPALKNTDDQENASG